MMVEGISEKDHERLFLKFYQLKPSLSRPQEGIGLGLYSCKLAVDSLGGKIGVKSSAWSWFKILFYYTFIILFATFFCLRLLVEIKRGRLV
jgi:signal transduction histidine kinase